MTCFMSGLFILQPSNLVGHILCLSFFTGVRTISGGMAGNTNTNTSGIANLILSNFVEHAETRVRHRHLLWSSTKVSHCTCSMLGALGRVVSRSYYFDTNDLDK